jgi:formate-nitrite transporter family protein
VITGGGRLTPPVGERDHVAGSLDAPVVLVEYGDFECPFCGMAYPIVAAARRWMGNRLCFVFRHFPLAEQHPHARHAAEAAEAAAAQGQFWPMHGLLFEHQRELTDEDLAEYARRLGLDVDRFVDELLSGAYRKRVRDDFRGGVRSGVNATPTFFINGERYDGDWSNQERFFGALELAAAERAGRTAAAP